MANLLLCIYLLIIWYEPDTILGVTDMEENKSLTLAAYFYLAEASSTAFGVIFLSKSDDSHVAAQNIQQLSIA